MKNTTYYRISAAILVVALLIMAAFNIQQANTINDQRALIRLLYHDTQVKCGQPDPDAFVREQ
jgi:hypothetical protein